MKTLKYIIIICFLSISCFYAEAVLIKGYTFSSKQEPLVGATISLISNDKIISTTQSDKNCYFVLSYENSGDYILNISHLGYMPLRISIKSHVDVELGLLELIENPVTLDEVTVKGDNIIQKVDKYIIFPDNSDLKRSTNTFGLLNKLNLPGLSIDIMRNAATIGGQSPIYQIDGIPKSKDDVLSLNPENILKIEYSDSPSIRYINDNIGGVINFILHEKESGGNLYANLYSSVTSSLISGYLGTSYSHKKSTLSLNYSCDWRENKYDIRGDEAYIGGIKPITELSTSLPSQKSLNNNITLSYLYQFNKNAVLNIALINRFGDKNNGGETFTLRKTGDIEKNIVNSNASNTLSNTHSLDVFFKKTIDSSQSLEMNVVGTLFQSDYNRDFYQSETNISTDNIYNHLTNKIDNKRWSLISEIAYHKAFKDISTNWGIKNTYSSTQNKYVPLNTTSKLNINDNYIYGDIQGRIKKVAYTVGTGLKSFYVQNDDAYKSYFRSISSMKLLYTPVKDFTFDYLFMYNPSLPSISDLSNVYQEATDITAKEGNPNLKPATWMRNRILVSYKYKNYSVRLWGIYDHTFTPIISDIYYNNTTNYFVYKPINAKYNSKYNIQLDLSVKDLFKYLSLSALVGYDHITSCGENFKHVLNNVYFRFNAFLNYKKFTFSGGFSFRENYNIIGETIVKPSNSINISAQYSFKDFIFSASIYNPLYKDGSKEISKSLNKVHPTYINLRCKDFESMVSLGIVYKVNFGKEFRRTRKSLNNYDNGNNMLIAE